MNKITIEEYRKMVDAAYDTEYSNPNGNEAKFKHSDEYNKLVDAFYNEDKEAGLLNNKEELQKRINGHAYCLMMLA